MYLHTKVIFFEPSIGRLISPYNLAFLRANLAMGRKRGKFFIKKKTNFSTNLYGPNDCSWLAKIWWKIWEEKSGPTNLGNLPPSRPSSRFFPKKKLHVRFLDRRLRVQNLMENLSSFLPTGLGSPLFIYFSLKKNSITPLKLCYLGAERHAADTARNDLHSSDPHPLALEVWR